MNSCDIAVVGAGAAGLMAAISASREAASCDKKISILLIDSKNKVGSKILISGGTRCNVTHATIRRSDYHAGVAHFTEHVFKAFSQQSTMDFFKEIGVSLVLEETGKYFPSTHSGRTVLEALLKECGRLRVQNVFGHKISQVMREEGCFELDGIRARRVILCTGGMSYPETGSDGTGYQIAKAHGHSILHPVPALTPLLSNDPDFHELSGVAVPVILEFYHNEKKEASSEGSFLFTHFGFSGPAALDISRYWSLTNNQKKSSLVANFCPRASAQEVRADLDSLGPDASALERHLTAHAGIPKRLTELLFKRAGIRKGRSLDRGWRERLMTQLFRCPLPVTGVYGFKKAEVTAGGVDLREVSFSTMESKKAPGLYFAGEIVDVDGRIGGFNFQWAWSSGAVAGRSAVRSLL